MARRWLNSSRQRWLAQRLTLIVLAMQGALLVALAVTPGDPPTRGTLWQLLWAASRRPTFYPLVILLMAGPPLSWLAWQVRGVHRRWLAIGWGTFTALLLVFFSHRVDVMLRVLWWQFGG